MIHILDEIVTNITMFSQWISSSVSCHNDSLVIGLVYGSFLGILVFLVFGISKSLREHRRPKLTFRESEKLIIYLFIYASRLWFAKCCKIQQLAYLYSTTFIYVQQDIFVFNVLYLYSTMRIFLQLQLKLFSFNNNICSTSTKIIFIQQQYLFNFNCHIYLTLNKNNCSTSIQTFFIQQKS